MRNFKTKLGKDGGIVIPTEYRRELGVEPGDELILHLNEDGLRLYTPAQAVARAQSLVRRYVPNKRRLSEGLISDRREATVRE